MGIERLFPALAAAGQPCSLSELSGKRIAVDMYVLLHQACFSFAKEIVIHNSALSTSTTTAAATATAATATAATTPLPQQQQQQHSGARSAWSWQRGMVSIVLKRIHLLIEHGITPLCVFDGRDLPAKEAEEQRRAADREAAKRRAFEELNAGNWQAAKSLFVQAVSVTPDMAREVIVALRETGWGVESIVAP